METEQLKFWRGTFGQGYIPRNDATAVNITSRIALWARIFQTLHPLEIKSLLEVGSNIGLNLRALRNLIEADFYAIEPFEEAFKKLLADGVVANDKAYNTSAFDMDMFQDDQIDLVFTSCVLIHIAPEDLKKATDNVVRIARKYVVCIEYFSDKEEQIEYRGYKGFLFKRDFGGFYLDNYPNLQLRDYGFAWRRATTLDNFTWWLFEKR